RQRRASSTWPSSSRSRRNSPPKFGSSKPGDPSCAAGRGCSGAAIESTVMADPAPETQEIPLREDGTQPDARPTSPWLENATTTEIPAVTNIFEQPAFGRSSRRRKLDEGQRNIWRVALAWLIAAMLGAGIGSYAMYQALGGTSVSGSVKVVTAPASSTGPVPDNQAAAVAKQVLPSIVEIDVSGPGAQGLGSGIIYTANGYIITNDHVISGADTIEVNLATGQKLPARVIGSAIGSGVDVAIPNVNATRLPAA